MDTFPTHDNVEAGTTRASARAGSRPPTDPASPPAKLGRPTTAWVIATFGVVAGLVPFLFFIAIPAGIVGLALGIGAWRKGRRHGVAQGKAGTVLGAVALGLGVSGALITFSVFEELEDDLDDVETDVDEADEIDQSLSG